MQFIATGDDAYGKVESFEMAEDAYKTYKLALLEGINAIQPIPLPPPHQPPIDPPLPNANNNNGNANNNGNIHEFRYMNSFQHLVAENLNLTDLQRLHYLKGSLVGDAKRLVQHYDIVDGNYVAAWEKLILCFDNKLL